MNLSVEVFMKIIFLLCIIFPLTSFAEERWHMVSFEADGFGSSITHEDIETKSGSPFKRVIYIFSDIGLNYAFRVSSRFQLGATYHTTHREYRLRSSNNGHSSVEIEEQAIGGFVLYNFSEDLNDSWYGGLKFSVIKYNEENSDEFQSAEGKGPFELDDSSELSEFLVGKRFSLRGFNVPNLAFSPQLSIYYKTHAKDFKDNRIGNGTGFTIQPIRFDLLF
jgi:hypothetical protein